METKYKKGRGKRKGILMRVAVNNDGYTGSSFTVDGLIEDL